MALAGRWNSAERTRGTGESDRARVHLPRPRGVNPLLRQRWRDVQVRHLDLLARHHLPALHAEVEGVVRGQLLDVADAGARQQLGGLRPDAGEREEAAHALPLLDEALLDLELGGHVGGARLDELRDADDADGVEAGGVLAADALEEEDVLRLLAVAERDARLLRRVQ